MYLREKALAVCERISSGESARKSCLAEGVKVPTFLLWCSQNADLAEHYARALSLRADVLFDGIEDVSEDAANADNAVRVAGLRLKSDNLKWQLARMSPRKYGDKLDLNHGGRVQFERIECVVVDPAG
jgi:hypothetical protein